MEEFIDSVDVVVRVRPLLPEEAVKEQYSVVRCVSTSEIEVTVGSQQTEAFNYSKCFSEAATQAEYFSQCGIVNLIDVALTGQRVCAFAFGQTGAGKTYTVLGPPSSSIAASANNCGVVGRSLDYVFSRLSDPKANASVRISCLEIYQEKCFDLFTDAKSREPLPLKEHVSTGYFVEGCKSMPCSSGAVASKAFDFAMSNRQVGSREDVSRSRKSHCVTDIFIDLRAGGTCIEAQQDGRNSPAAASYQSVDSVRQSDAVGRITIVDLAGSERVKETTSKSLKKVAVDHGVINKSIYVLGKVISGLVRNHGSIDHPDVPYKDSKLTKLLINSLGGKKSLLMVCISGSSGCLVETLRTLKFSVSCLGNKSNMNLSPNCKDLTDTVYALKQEIYHLQSENGHLRKSVESDQCLTVNSKSSAALSVRALQIKKTAALAAVKGSMKAMPSCMVINKGLLMPIRAQVSKEKQLMKNRANTKKSKLQEKAKMNAERKQNGEDVDMNDDVFRSVSEQVIGFDHKFSQGVYKGPSHATNFKPSSLAIQKVPRPNGQSVPDLRNQPLEDNLVPSPKWFTAAESYDEDDDQSVFTSNTRPITGVKKLKAPGKLPTTLSPYTAHLSREERKGDVEVDEIASSCSTMSTKVTAESEAISFLRGVKEAAEADGNSTQKPLNSFNKKDYQKLPRPKLLVTQDPKAVANGKHASERSDAADAKSVSADHDGDDDMCRSSSLTSPTKEFSSAVMQTPIAARLKLQIFKLEKHLREKRLEMEDCPGMVTNDIEKTVSRLERELAQLQDDLLRCNESDGKMEEGEQQDDEQDQEPMVGINNAPAQLIQDSIPVHCAIPVVSDPTVPEAEAVEVQDETLPEKEATEGENETVQGETVTAAILTTAAPDVDVEAAADDEDDEYGDESFNMSTLLNASEIEIPGAAKEEVQQEALPLVDEKDCVEGMSVVDATSEESPIVVAEPTSAVEYVRTVAGAVAVVADPPHSVVESSVVPDVGDYDPVGVASRGAKEEEEKEFGAKQEDEKVVEDKQEEVKVVETKQEEKEFEAKEEEKVVEDKQEEEEYADDEYDEDFE